MTDCIAHTKPFFDHRELDAAQELIKTRMVNEGDVGRRLASRITELANSLGGVVTSCGTLGLHLALKVLGVKKEDDEVIIPDVACRSLYDCVRLAGGTPIFCDINLDDFSLDIGSVRSRLSRNTRAIILPHMYGCPSDIDSFITLDVPIIEDCAHSLGALYRDLPVGSFGHLSCFSMEGSKLIAAGEGGIVLANREESLTSLNTLRFGLDGHFAYPYRLSDLAASLALVQLDKLPSMIVSRRRIADIYYNGLKILEDKGSLMLPHRFAARKGVYYRFVVLCDVPSSDLIEFANSRGVLIRNPLPSGCLVDTFGNIPVHNPNSRRITVYGASLPIYPDLTADEAARVVDVVHSYFDRAK
jgi:perosamine synthetase